MRSWVLLIRSAFALLLFLLAFATALFAGALLPYLVAAWSANIALLALSAISAFALVTWGGGWLAGLAWHAKKRTKFANNFSMILSAAFVVALYFAILRPSPTRLADPIGFSDTRYWKLPTGSRIAYIEYDPPTGMAVNPNPVVFLHGGPGMRIGPSEIEFFGSLAAHGFRVLLFDQAGSGLSDFLPKVSDYTMARAVADLEAIRQQLQASKMILIGHSWGATLAASYMAKYPERVAKVIFYSPGPIWNVPLEMRKADYSRTEWRRPDFPPPRLLAAFLLLHRNPAAAQNLLPQREAEELFVHLIAPMGGMMVCKGDAGRLPRSMSTLATSNLNPSLNPYVAKYLPLSTQRSTEDPHTALRANQTPAMILSGECDYVPWSSKLDYQRTFSKATLYYLPKAGHFIQFEQPELMRRMILAFLKDQPDIVPPYVGEVDPRTVHP
jgi:proline iminopeptidase